MRERLVISVLVLLCVQFGTVHADLIDRGGGLIYDTDFDITWLADACYAKTSGYDADGLMIWAEATAWADQLVYGGYDNWRLPTARNSEGALPTNSSSNPFNHSDSELGHLFYDELGGIANESIYVSTDPDLALFSNIDGWLAEDKRSGAPAYWTSDHSQFHSDRYWYFAFSNGSQWAERQWYALNAWAVHDGDVAQVPVPTAIILGLLGLGTVGMKLKR
jgi:Protein of unknown function (DUF1566)